MYRRPSNEFEKSLNLLKIYYKTQQNVIFLTRMEFIKIEWLYVASIGNIITDNQCVILTSPLQWGSCRKFVFCLVRQPKSYIVAQPQKYILKSSLIFFFYTWCTNTKLDKDFCFSTSVEHNCSNTVIFNLFTFKRFVCKL